MNFSLLQWVLSFVLDVLIKAPVFIFLGLLVTFGLVSNIGFVFIAIMFSTFHFFCLFLSRLILILLERLGLKPSSAAEFAFVLVVANGLFVSSYAAFTGLGHRPDEVLPGFAGQAIFGSLIALTNILSISIMAVCGRFVRRNTL